MYAYTLLSCQHHSNMFATGVYEHVCNPVEEAAVYM